MQIKMENAAADFGFIFFEKLHVPMFLVDRDGRLQQFNSAGRKFIKAIKLNTTDLERYSSEFLKRILPSTKIKSKSVNLENNRFTIIATNLGDSQLILVELKRCPRKLNQSLLEKKNRWACKISHYD